MSTQSRPRQFTLEERIKHFPLDFTVENNGTPTIKVPAAWERANLVRIGPYKNIHLKFSPRVHLKAAGVFSALFERMVTERTLEHNELTNAIITYDGGFVARLKRGASVPAGSPKSAYEKHLSNHSRGTAIDLNAKWNRMGIPYSEKRMGGVGDLAYIIDMANHVRVEQEDGTHWGIVCGAHWKGASIDPMHFEIGVWP